MKLAPYSVFGKLRLRKWFPDDDFLEEESKWYRLISERIRGMGFTRSMDHPDETFTINIDLFDFIEDLRFEVLGIIGLPLKPGMTPDQVKSLLGEPESSDRSRRLHSSWCEFKSDLPEQYSIACSFSDERGLWSVTVTRLDIPFPKAEDERDSTLSPSEHSWLREHEVLPENILSPESPISKMRLLTESDNFRYLIHVRHQKGIVIDAAELIIRNSTTKQNTTRIPIPLATPDTNSGVIEISGHIDKELLFRTFVQLWMRDEIHQTSQNVFIEFDQWYGKYVG